MTMKPSQLITIYENREKESLFPLQISYELQNIKKFLLDFKLFQKLKAEKNEELIEYFIEYCLLQKFEKYQFLPKSYENNLIFVLDGQIQSKQDNIVKIHQLGDIIIPRQEIYEVIDNTVVLYLPKMKFKYFLEKRKELQSQKENYEENQSYINKDGEQTDNYQYKTTQQSKKTSISDQLQSILRKTHEKSQVIHLIQSQQNSFETNALEKKKQLQPKILKNSSQTNSQIIRASTLSIERVFSQSRLQEQIKNNYKLNFNSQRPFDFNKLYIDHQKQSTNNPEKKKTKKLGIFDKLNQNVVLRAIIQKQYLKMQI